MAYASPSCGTSPRRPRLRILRKPHWGHSIPCHRALSRARVGHHDVRERRDRPVPGDLGRRHLPARRGGFDLRFETIEVAGEPDVASRCARRTTARCWRTAWRCGGCSLSTPETASTRRFTGSLDSCPEAFKAHAEPIHAPGLNMMYGDAEGDIAWIASAKLPIRPGSSTPRWRSTEATPPTSRAGTLFDVNPVHQPGRRLRGSANNAPSPTTAWPTRALLRGQHAPRASWMRSTERTTGPGRCASRKLDHHSPVYRKTRPRWWPVKQGGADVPAFMDGWDGDIWPPTSRRRCTTVGCTARSSYVRRV